MHAVGGHDRRHAARRARRRERRHGFTRPEAPGQDAARRDPERHALRRRDGAQPELTLGGDAGFVPAVPGIGLLPDGCTTPGWPPSGGGGEVRLPPEASRPPALLGGLPATVVCDLGTLTPEDPPQLRDLVALVRPWYRDGDGIDKEPSATVTLRLQDPEVDPGVPPEVHAIATQTIVIDLPDDDPGRNPTTRTARQPS
jgi:hypothetical protein